MNHKNQTHVCDHEIHEVHERATSEQKRDAESTGGAAESQSAETFVVYVFFVARSPEIHFWSKFATEIAESTKGIAEGQSDQTFWDQVFFVANSIGSETTSASPIAQKCRAAIVSSTKQILRQRSML